MTATTMSTLAEIREVNLSYVLLAQRLLREDRVLAMHRLGLSEEVAEIVSSLTPAQAVKIAASSHVLCRFRFDDHAILTSLADKDKRAALTQAELQVALSDAAIEIG
ncbi:flagellar transcriptional regulator FlhD [Caballeronia sp. M1242]|uniref:flagellar transcriptional regulator FlhD n=1 Tax=Caballeronia sp. M1242 TaxID=2814653 RepID=UPI0019D2E207|nr:flagellar transcriptional regulator FlhD [Caballeronia sp. M1242]QSN61444.1 flagellar transcriptional regulator FlhD [Caballeronia sp. M1242]